MIKQNKKATIKTREEICKELVKIIWRQMDELTELRRAYERLKKTDEVGV